MSKVVLGLEQDLDDALVTWVDSNSRRSPKEGRNESLIHVKLDKSFNNEVELVDWRSMYQGVRDYVVFGFGWWNKKGNEFLSLIMIVYER